MLVWLPFIPLPCCASEFSFLNIFYIFLFHLVAFASALNSSATLRISWGQRYTLLTHLESAKVTQHTLALQRENNRKKNQSNDKEETLNQQRDYVQNQCINQMVRNHIILNINSLSILSFENIFSKSVASPVTR